MKLAHIAPTAVLKTATFRDLSFHLCISSQVLKDLTYAHYYRHAKGHVILDVPTYEERDLAAGYDPRKLNKAIELVQPSEVVLPDVWGGTAQQAIDAALEACLVLPRVTSRGPLGFMAVPRGDTWEECLDCAKIMSDLPGVTTLGILDTSYEKFEASRSEVVHEFKVRFPHLSLHLLGVMRDCSDISDTKIRDRVRSADTSKFVRWGLDCRYPVYKNIPTYPGRGADYFEREASEVQISYIAKNIRYWNILTGDRSKHT